MDIEALRAAIDQCDERIVQILNERARLAQEVGRIKREQGKAVFAPEREKMVYERVIGLNPGPLPARTLQAIYREIMSGCIALEKPTRIAYLGPAGTFTHEAAIHKFGACMEYLPQPEIRDVFLAVARDHADYGVVPIENSTEGSVNATNDMLIESSLCICSEIFLEIHQNLIANCPLNEVKLVVSKDQALAQCRQWLAANLPGVPTREVPSTALAAERAQRERGVAAIASEAAAKIYNLSHIIRCIEDKPDNATRFIVLGHSPAKPSGDDRTTVVFAVANEAGSLYSALLPFKKHGVNLTRIESRPSKKVNWEYTFFVDLEGHMENEKVRAALEEMAKVTDDFRILGSYPRAEHLIGSPPPSGSGGRL